MKLGGQSDNRKIAVLGDLMPDSKMVEVGSGESTVEIDFENKNDLLVLLSIDQNSAQTIDVTLTNFPNNSHQRLVILATGTVVKKLNFPAYPEEHWDGSDHDGDDYAVYFDNTSGDTGYSSGESYINIPPGISYLIELQKEFNDWEGYNEYVIRAIAKRDSYGLSNPVELSPSSSNPINFGNKMFSNIVVNFNTRLYTGNGLSRLVPGSLHHVILKHPFTEADGNNIEYTASDIDNWILNGVTDTKLVLPTSSSIYHLWITRRTIDGTDYAVVDCPQLIIGTASESEEIAGTTTTKASTPGGRSSWWDDLITTVVQLPGVWEFITGLRMLYASVDDNGTWKKAVSADNGTLVLGEELENGISSPKGYFDFRADSSEISIPSFNDDGSVNDNILIEPEFIGQDLEDSEDKALSKEDNWSTSGINSREGAEGQHSYYVDSRTGLRYLIRCISSDEWVRIPLYESLRKIIDSTDDNPETFHEITLADGEMLILEISRKTVNQNSPSQIRLDRYIATITNDGGNPGNQWIELNDDSSGESSLGVLSYSISVDGTDVIVSLTNSGHATDPVRSVIEFHSISIEKIL